MRQKIQTIFFIVLSTIFTACGGGGGGGSSAPLQEVADAIVFETGTLQSDYIGEAISEANESCIAAFDMDGDSDSDIVCLMTAGTSGIIWYENEANKTFTRQTTNIYPGGYFISAAEINGDNHPDLFITTDESIQIYINDGNESYSEYNVTTNINSAFITQLVDVDGDGDMDVVSSFDKNYFSWYENDGSLHFSEHNISTPNIDSQDVRCVDSDNDGDMDFVMTPYSSGNMKQVVVYQNDGSNNFSEFNISIENEIEYLDTGDINGDGLVDIVTSGVDKNVVLLVNNGANNFSEYNISTQDDTATVKIVDIDSDGVKDILYSVNNSSFSVNILKQDTPLHFSETKTNAISYMLETTDIDGDGNLDFAPDIIQFFIGKSADWYEKREGFYVDENSIDIVQIVANSLAGKDINYSIGGVDGDKFTIDKDQGTLSFNAPKDFENPDDADKNGIYLLSVTAEDENLSKTLNFFVGLQNVVDTPPLLLDTNLSVDEASSVGSYVGYVNYATKGDSDIVSYTISGVGSDKFTIDNSGKIVVAQGAVLDYEVDNNFSLNVYASNTAGDSMPVTANIFLNDVLFFKGDSIYAPDAEVNASFGSSISISGDYFLVGASSDGVANRGSVYLYKKGIDNNVTNIQKILSPDPIDDERFGLRVVMEGDYIYISGGYIYPARVYVFKKDTNDTVSYITKLDTGNHYIHPSDITAIGNYLLVPLYDNSTVTSNDSPTISMVGGVLVYKMDSNDTITEVARLEASDAKLGDDFGYSVDMSGDYIIVGARTKDLDADNNNTGGAYLFKNDGNDNFSQVAIIEPSDINSNDFFGSSVSIENNYIAIGAPWDDINGSTNTGSIYLYKIENNSVVLQQKISSPNLSSYDYFGMNVDIDNGFIFETGYKSYYSYLLKIDSLTDTAQSVQKFILKDATFAKTVDTLLSGYSGDDTVAENAGAVSLFYKDPNQN